MNLIAVRNITSKLCLFQHLYKNRQCFIKLDDLIPLTFFWTRFPSYLYFPNAFITIRCPAADTLLRIFDYHSADYTGSLLGCHIKNKSMLVY